MRTRNLLMAPAFLLVLGVFVLASRAPEASAVLPGSPQEGEEADAHRHVGVIVDWRMEKDGTVYLLLEKGLAAQDFSRESGQDRSRSTAAAREASETRLWFKTPPIQGQQVHFQDLVMLMILHSQQHDTMSRFSIWGERTHTTRGETMEGAIAMSMIGPG